MSETVIKVENLSKRYQLGSFGYGSLQHDLAALWAKMRGKEDPNTKIGEVSRFDRHGEFWALKDVSFEVKQGDRLGILGRNGAGKSTLLKILSRVTSPTEGRVKIKGRVASLLEVGTGFNPELTGRENVYLNGAIMGMKRFEIRQRFDEIVEFSGIPQFIDTPVKRYSSGMKVKLAFAVAAHLDSEILIADEVLAVGDAEFQKKSLGKMEDISTKQGRTVLFVSHNMGAITALCTSGLLMEDGAVKMGGSIQRAIEGYLSTQAAGKTADGEWIPSAQDTANASITKVRILRNGQGFGGSTIEFRDTISFEIDYQVVAPVVGHTLCITCFRQDSVAFTLFECSENEVVLSRKEPGDYRVRVDLPQVFAIGQYAFSFGFVAFGQAPMKQSDRILPFEVIVNLPVPKYHHANYPTRGVVSLEAKWAQM